MATVLKDPLEREMRALGEAARAASAELALAPRAAKDEALLAGAAALRRGAEAILAANARDMAAARAKGLSAAMLDRLELNPKRVAAMAEGLETVAALDDPVGTELARWTRPNGLDIARVRVPLGVVGIIYESRPNVTADAGALCLKAGNAAILRGGSESFHSSAAILAALGDGLAVAGLPAAAIQAVPTADRAAVGHLLRMAEQVDVIVPRGGRSLIERVHGGEPDPGARPSRGQLPHLSARLGRPGDGGGDRGQCEAAPDGRVRGDRDPAGRPGGGRAPAAAGAGRR